MTSSDRDRRAPGEGGLPPSRSWASRGSARGGTHNVLRVAAGPSSGVSAGEVPEASWERRNLGATPFEAVNQPDLEAKCKVRYPAGMGFYTIGQLARAVGVPTTTLRYYERVKILRPDGRTGGNYRVYGAAALERLRFIRAAQANGFTLDDISVLMSFRDGATARCKEVQALIQDRLADLRRRMEQMREVEAVLFSSLKMCRQFERTGRCQVIDKLNQAAASSTPKKARRRLSK